MLSKHVASLIVHGEVSWDQRVALRRRCSIEGHVDIGLAEVHGHTCAFSTGPGPNSLPYFLLDLHFLKVETTSESRQDQIVESDLFPQTELGLNSCRATAFLVTLLYLAL